MTRTFTRTLVHYKTIPGIRLHTKSARSHFNDYGLVHAKNGGIEPPSDAVRKSGIGISKNGQYSFRYTLDLTRKIGHRFSASQLVSHHRQLYFFIDT